MAIANNKPMAVAIGAAIADPNGKPDSTVRNVRATERKSYQDPRRNSYVPDARTPVDKWGFAFGPVLGRGPVFEAVAS